MANTLYRAIDPNGRGIITVVAENAAHAVQVIDEQLLQNGSRRAYRARWIAGGCRVEEYDMVKVEIQ